MISRTLGSWILNALEWFKKLFGIAPAQTAVACEDKTEFVSKYEDITEYNITAIVSNKLANIVCSESQIEVIGDNPRAVFLNTSLQRCVDHLKLIITRVFGYGGVVLKPYTYNGQIYTDILAQNRFFVIESHGDVITKAGFVADIATVGNTEYTRMEYHTLDENGTYTIENKAIANDNPVSLETVPQWAGIPPILTIQNVEQMLFTFIKCPADNRQEIALFSGVPITYGNDKLIREIVDLLNEMQKEFALKRAFVGADIKLFDEHDELVRSGLYKRFNDSGGSVGDKAFWEVYSPNIRVNEYIEGINFKYSQLESAIGVNKGVLTDLSTADATATAIEYSSFDTEALADAMHKNIEAAIRELAYSYDVIANAFQLAPKGNYDLKFSWMNWSERSADRWRQLVEGISAGIVRPEEGRMYLFDESEETAIEKLPQMIDLLEAR